MVWFSPMKGVEDPEEHWRKLLKGMSRGVIV